MAQLDAPVYVNCTTGLLYGRYRVAGETLTVTDGWALRRGEINGRNPVEVAREILSVMAELGRPMDPEDA